LLLYRFESIVIQQLNRLNRAFSLTRFRNSLLPLASCGAFLLASCAQSPEPQTASPPSSQTYCFECTGGPNEYFIFFDWNSDELTSKATTIISRFLYDNKATPFKEIYISGHTDSSGPDPYNMRLSFERAQAVANRLIAGGVSKNKVKLFGYGDAHMLVPTLSNIRAPQNRRVEIFAYPVGTPIPGQPYQTGPLKIIRFKNGIMVE
jgi:hypothetical protein